MPRAYGGGGAGVVNDLSASARRGGGSGGGGGGVPMAVPCVLVQLLFAGLCVAVFILAVIHNALILVFAVTLAIFRWNAAASRSGSNGALVLFLDRFLASNLRSAAAPRPSPWPSWPLLLLLPRLRSYANG